MRMLQYKRQITGGVLLTALVSLVLVALWVGTGSLHAAAAVFGVSILSVTGCALFIYLIFLAFSLMFD